jgi:hypothetical protein
VSILSNAVPPPDPSSELAVLGLKLSDFEHALRRGEAERRTCTEFDPPSLPPWLQWGRTVAGFREQVVPTRGWHMDNAANVPRTIHPERQFAVVVNTGDEGTGDLNRAVSTRYPRGPVGRRAVEVNGQLALFEMAGETPPTGEMPTWFLLVHRMEDEIHSELSLARTIDKEGFITDWSKRIPLPPLPYDGSKADGEEGDDGPDFDVTVKRR